MSIFKNEYPQISLKLWLIFTVLLSTNELNIYLVQLEYQVKDCFRKPKATEFTKCFSLGILSI